MHKKTRSSKVKQDLGRKMKEIKREKKKTLLNYYFLITSSHMPNRNGLSLVDGPEVALVLAS